MHWSMDHTFGASQVALVVKNPPVMQDFQEMWVWPLSQEDPWRRAWQPSPVFLPGESHGQRSLAGYHPWGSQKAGHDWSDIIHAHMDHTLVALLKQKLDAQQHWIKMTEEFYFQLLKEKS